MGRFAVTPRTATLREAGAACPGCVIDICEGDSVSVCPDCGGVHHATCWERDGGCQAYSCAPARRGDLEDRVALVITEKEIARAQPWARARTAPGWSSTEPSAPRRLSRTAVASFIISLLGIPLFGLVTGLIAILTGLVAVSGSSKVRGKGFAVAGISIGALEFMGWLVALVIIVDPMTITHRAAGTAIDFRPDAAALEGLDPVIARAMCANVLIERRDNWLGGSIGSGVILRMDAGEAIIVTNRHVIAPGENFRDTDLAAANDGKLTVTLVDQPATPGRVVWLAPHGIDLALVRVPCKSPKAAAARWRRGRSAHVGDRVFAIGNPHNLGWTHTEGTLSQFRRSGTGPSEVKVVQTQAALNPGNSGGGLYTREGWLVGINTWTNDRRISEGLGFAIELDSLLEHSPPGLGPAGEP